MKTCSSGPARWHALAPFLLAAAPAAQAQSGWADYVDETATRLVGDPGVLTDDLEKHLHADDVDLDGWVDLIVGRKHPFTFTGERTNVLFMNEGGVLVDRTAALIPSFQDVSNTRGIITFDADGDGWPDIVEANTLYDQPRLWRNLGRDGGGVFLGFVEDLDALATVSHQNVKLCSVSAADVDGDGDLDLYRNDLEDRILLNDGTGIFTDVTDTHMSASASFSNFVIDGEFADFNGDGAPDILKVEDNTDPLRIVYNDGSGFFFEEQSLPTGRTHQAVPADFDNDGRLDLYVVDSEQDYFFMNQGNDASGQVIWLLVPLGASPLTAEQGGSVRAVDVDRDGYVDVLVSDIDLFEAGCERRFALLRNTTGVHGVPALEEVNPAALPWNAQGVFDAVAFDVDRDGVPDLVQGSCSGLFVWMGQPLPLPGTPYCDTAPHSAGAGARIHAHGSASIAANDLRLVVEHGVPGQLGIFYYGPGQVQVPFGNGLRCIGGATFRLLPPQTTGAGGLASRRLDFTAAPAASGPGQIQPGATWNFQFWYRDPDGGGAQFNLSDAVSIDFEP